MMKWLLSIVFFVVCSANAKATRGGAKGTSLYSVLLEIDDTQAPRPIADRVFGDPFVQGCLRNALLNSGDDFSVRVSGLLSPRGVVSQVTIEHQNDSLRDCLSDTFLKLKLGRGKSGPFKIEISRLRVTPPPGKTYELDLNEPKKFQ